MASYDELKVRLHAKLLERADKTLRRAESGDSFDANATVLKAHELLQAAKAYRDVFGNEPRDS